MWNTVVQYDVQIQSVSLVVGRSLRSLTPAFG